MTGWQIVPHMMSPAAADLLALIRSPALATSAASSSGAAAPTQGPLVAVLGVVFAALFVAGLLVAGSVNRDKASRLLADRIERYGPRHAPATADGDGKAVGAAVGWVTNLLRSSNTERGLADRLDLAGIGRKPAEWVLLGCCASVALAAVLTLLLGNALAGILVGALAGWLGMRLTVSTRIGRRRAAFSQQLPDVLQLIASSLQSGFSLPQALDAVVRDDTQPAAGEFSRALAETRIGAELEDALNRAAERMDSIDLRWTVMAIRIQREVGGNLAEVLRNVVDTMRERAYLRRQVRALSAEGRLSGYVIVALPVVIGAWLFFRDPEYMRPLYTTPAGVIMLAAAGVLIVLGSLWMRALIKVEV
jgi:Flp pilus assembly protein TadB